MRLTTHQSTDRPKRLAYPPIFSKTMLSNFMLILLFGILANSTEAATDFAFMPPGNCPGGATVVGGIVFNDYDYDGDLNSNDTVGIKGVAVYIYGLDVNGNSVELDNTETDAKGEYYFTGIDFSSGNNYRVEFIIPDSLNYYKASFRGSDSQTSVRFISAASCEVHFAMARPVDYCQTNPSVVTPCYINGTGVGSSSEALVSFGYNAPSTGDGSGIPDKISSGTGVEDPVKVATADQLGSTWGLAHQAASERLFAASFLKRHVGLADGPGYVYLIDYSSGSGSVLGSFNLQGVTPLNGGSNIDLGSVTRVTSPSTDDNYITSTTGDRDYDIDAFGKVGSMSFADIEMEEDKDVLWMVNLNQRALIRMNASGNNATLNGASTATLNTLVNQYLIENITNVPSCPGGDVLRPWALAFRDGKGYLGCTCDASVTQDAANLKAYVLSFDPDNLTTTGFTEETSFDLNYNRELSGAFLNAGTISDWGPWVNTWTDLTTIFGSETNSHSPVLSDIEFNEKGDMILGISDRIMNQMQESNFAPAPGDMMIRVGGLFSSGDLIHLCNTGSGFALEGTAGCAVSDDGDGTTRQQMYTVPLPAEVINDGPSGNGEFYYQDNHLFGDPFNPANTDIQGHNEITTGALAIRHGSWQVLSTTYDPIRSVSSVNTQGIQWYDTEDGSFDDGYMLVPATMPGSFVKGSGLGDLELLCNEAPIQIGTFVWKDNNGNGVQDPGESPISGVNVSLFDATFDSLATVTSDVNGYVEFDESTSGITELVANATYYIAYGKGQFDITEKSLFDSLAITAKGIGMGALPAQNDSDGAIASGVNAKLDGYPFVAFTLGNAGEVQHSIALGLATNNATIGNYVWLDEDGNGMADAGETGIPNVQVDLKDAGGTVVATTTTDAMGGYLFTGLGNGSYTVSVKTSSLPTGLNNQTGDPDVTMDNEYTADLSAGGEDLTGHFGYNWNSATETNTPLVSATAAIGDRIWNDADGDGKQDMGEAGIKNVQVELYNDHDNDGVYDNLVTSTTTDAAGYYIFDNLPIGAYVIEVNTASIPGTFNSTPTGDPDNDANNIAEPVVLAPGDVYLNQEFGYQPTSSSTISNLIFYDFNGDGNQTGSEPSAAGVSVALLDNTNTVIASMMTNESGNYAFSGLPAGTYTVWVTDTKNVLAAHKPASDPDGGDDDRSIVTVDGTSNNTLQDFGYMPKGHSVTDGLIGDQVFFDYNGNNMPDQGEGQKDITVSLYKDELINGGMTMNHATGGTASAVNAQTAASAASDGNTDGDWANGSVWNTSTSVANPWWEMDMTSRKLIDDIHIHNRKDCCQALLSNAWILISDDPFPVLLATALADADIDQFQLGDMSSTNDITVTINSSGRYVRVWSPNTSHLNIAEVEVNGPLTVEASNLVAVAETDDNGRYFFGGLTKGDYDVKVDAGDIPTGMNITIDPDGNLPPNEESAVDLSTGAQDMLQDFGYTTTSTNSIGGTVWEDTDANGNLNESNTGFPDVTVGLYNSSGKQIASTTTDGTGNFTFPNLIDGTYVVVVNDGDNKLDGYWHAIGASAGSDNNSQSNAYSVTVNSNTANTTADFGYFRIGAALGNYVFDDINGDGLQDGSDMKLPNVQVQLGIDYDRNGSDDITLTTVTDANGFYDFSNLLLDEDATGNVPASEPIYTLSATAPMDYTTTTINTGSNTYIDSEDPTGTVVQPLQGRSDVSAKVNPGDETVAATYDFGFKQIVLPVDLINFTAEVVDCDILLKWETANEDRFSHFEIERSRDGQKFETIGITTAVGGFQLKSYEHMDKAALVSALYRLKMVDIDGQYRYSGLLFAETNCDGAEGIAMVFPNPVEEYESAINVRIITQERSAMIYVVDMQGKMVRRLPLALEKGANLVRIDVNDLAPGTYFIGLEQDREKFKFIKLGASK